MDLTKIYVGDIETYKDLFSLSIMRVDGKHKATMQVSKFQNDIERIIRTMDYLRDNQCYFVSFNGVNFDYPIMHEVYTQYKLGKKITPKLVHAMAQKQIDSFKGGAFGNTVKAADQLFKQLDLYRINHYDNLAKATSLKLLEFNMRMDNIIDLPYGIEQTLTKEMIDEILAYNEHDVEATRQFFHLCKPSVEFRLALTEKYGRDFNNHNDGKIGKDYFIMKLEECGIKLYEFKGGKRTMRQTPREKINIGECLFDYYDFTRPEFVAVKDWFAKQVIKETKGVFSDILESNLGEVAKYAEMVVKRKKFKLKPSEQEVAEFYKAYPLGWIDEEELKATESYVDEYGKKQKRNKVSYWMNWRVAETLNVVVNGFRVDFGTGGAHGSLSTKVVKETKGWVIRDEDVSSFYPNLAISNRLYPAHLGEEFCDIYQDVYDQRKSYPKGSPENLMLKLGLNSVYGDSASMYSVFYDPQYTMSITVNGQLTLCLLIDMLDQKLKDGMKMVMVNTDGITFAIKREHKDVAQEICRDWERKVKLQLEGCYYSKMFIRDVNSYVGVYSDE